MSADTATLIKDRSYGTNGESVCDPLDWQDALGVDAEQAHKLALKARNARMRDLRLSGVKCRGWSLAGQLRPYAGLGQPDGRVRTVYYVSFTRDHG